MIPRAAITQKVEAAFRETLMGWCEEFDIGRKFWWMDWNNMARPSAVSAP